VSTAGVERVLIVGASLAGATVAFSLREVGFDGDIVLVGAETALPYERPALSKSYLAGEVELARLLVRPVGDYDAQRVQLRLGQVATGLDVDSRVVTLASGEQLAYDHLVIATGASNARPPIPGIDLAGVHQLRTAADAGALRAELPGLDRAVVVGMGFIGCEIAATLTTLGIDVAAVDPMPGPLWGPLGPQLSGVVRHWHEARGVRLINGVGVTAFLPDDGGSTVAAVELTDGRHLDAELVVVGVGVRPATTWLVDAPLHLAGGAVGVDGGGRTNLPGVYAAGDVTATWDEGLSAHVRHEHWANAIDQGRRVANTITGRQQPPPAVPWFWSDQYDRSIQYAGQHDADCHLVVRGDLTEHDGPLMAFFLRAGTLAAVVSVDSGKELRRAQRLIGHPVDPAALAEPAVDLRRLPTLTAATG
jgi:3-phenylpropionate/trans-cinnamate dioxygenase ferredoxin reductase subunit